MANKSKDKGGNFEREICKSLSLWWTEGEDDNIFWRTEGSGNRATVRTKAGKKTKYSYGDVTTSHPDGTPFIDTFLLELKTGYKKEGVFNLIIDSNAKQHIITAWWMKAEEERIEGERKYSMIIYRRKDFKPCIIINMDLCRKLQQLYEWVPPRIILHIKPENLCLVCMGMEEFFSTLDPETIRAGIL